MFTRATLILSIGVVLITAATAHAGIFRCRNHHQEYCDTPPPLAQSIQELIVRTGMRPEALPNGSFPADTSVLVGIGVEWSKVQTQLESLFQKRLALDVKLPLLIDVVDDKVQPPLVKLIIPDPKNEQVKNALVDAIKFRRDIFSTDARLVGETVSILNADLKPEFLKDGKPHLVLIQQAIQRMLLADSPLSKAASELGVGLKPINTKNEITETGLTVNTEWQEFDRRDSAINYWRVHVRFERQPQDYWQLESVIQLGERSRGQSPDQIHIISDTNQLAGYATSTTHAYVGSQPIKEVVVRFRAVDSAGKSYANIDSKSQLSRMAPMLWTQVRDTLLVWKK